MKIDDPGPATWSRRFLAILVLAWIPAFIGTGAVEAAADLLPVAMAGNPYFVPRHALLLYVWLPIVTISSFVLLLSPGLLLTLLVGEDLDLDRWILYGFGISLVLVSVAAGLVQAVAGAPLTGRAFAAVPAVLSVLAFIAADRRTRAGRSISLPRGADSHAAIATYLVPAILLLVLLLPKFLWETFNDDGVHAFESTRLLLSGPLPFWDPEIGALSQFPGLSTMLFTYPASWFVRLFGTTEAAARLPFVLHMVVLTAAIVGIARWGRSGPSVTSRWLLWPGLAAFSLAMGFSATYNPYHADFALPGVQDALMMVCYLGFVGAFLRQERGWMAVFVVLTALSQANWALLIGLWLLAVVLVWRPVPWRTVVFSAGLAAVTVLGLALLPALFEAVGLPPPGTEYETGALVERLEFIRLDHWAQFLFVLIPCGIFPAIYLFAWRRLDHVARAATIVTVLYFAFFYVQAYVSLHYFVPAMVLPLVVLWRADESFLGRWSVRAAMLGTGVLAVWLAIPVNTAPHVHARTVGSAVLDTRGGYEAYEPGFFEPLPLFWELFRRPRDPRVPELEYGGAPLVWSYYAQSAGDRSPNEINYVLQSAEDPPPEGARELASRGGVRLYVRSDSVWNSHLGIRESPSVARPFTIPRNILFRSAGQGRDAGAIDVKALLNRLLGRS
jgi:hypothetical protein